MEGEKKQLRVYNENTQQYFLYKEMHKNQTLDFVKGKYNQYNKLNNKVMDIHTALSLLDDFIDPSDPDLDLENSVHAYQTAERIRKKYPEDKQLQITGLIHDLGKVLFSIGEPSWSVVGDTYVVGCEFPKSIVYYETLKDNPDFLRYTKNGIYQEGCGIDNLYITFGHDEYLYRVLKYNSTKHKLDQKYLDIIRYHSFYPWHTEGEYKQFMNTKDEITMKNVIMFNEFDLYSKEDDTFIDDNVKLYYKNLLNEYFTGELQW